MKGIVMTLILIGAAWCFWMSWEWLRNRNKNKPNKPE
jgi:threonine/homoserine/homoserine lactone efflux protein